MQQQHQPTTITTEHRLLGILLCDVTDVGPVVAELSKDLFTGARGAIFEAIKTNHEAGNPINVVTVGKTLVDSKQGQLVSEMASCIDGIYNGHKWRLYVGHLREAQTSRHLEAIKADLLRDFDIERAFHRLQALQAQTMAASVLVAHDMLVDWMVNLEKQISGRNPLEVVPTGLRPLDRLLVGFMPGELIYMGGRPGMGKTLLAMQLAMNQAAMGHCILFVTIEMSGGQLMARIASNLAEVEGSAFLDPHARINQTTYLAMGIAIDKMKNEPLLICDMPDATIQRIDAELTKLRTKKIPVKGMYVDYLQLLQPMPDDKGKSKTEQVTNLSKAFKALVRRHGIFGVVVCSLSRNTEQRGDHRPLLSDLRESGQLEFDADKVIFVHRPAEYMAADERALNQNKMEIIVRKNRNGQQGTAHVMALLQYTKAVEYPPNHQPCL